jgi:uncharacterized protein
MLLTRMVLKIRWKRVFTALLVLYVLGLVFTFLFPDRLVLFPSRERIDVPGTTRNTISGPAGELEIWTARTDAARSMEPQAYVLAFNGNGSRAERELARLQPMWAHHPVEIWAVNYPGFGGSAGEAKLAEIPPAALAAYDALALHAKGKPIFISGHSIGTTPALYLGTKRPVAGLVLHNPPPLRQLIMGRFGWFNFWIAASVVAHHVPKELDSLSNGKRCTAPALFIQAGHDTLVRPKYQRMVVDAYAGPKQEIHVSVYGHNDPQRVLFWRELSARDRIFQ